MANIHIIPFRTATFRFCKVVWQHYLGEVGKFDSTLWLIFPRHCISSSIKIGQVLYKYLLVYLLTSLVFTYLLTGLDFT